MKKTGTQGAKSLLGQLGTLLRIAAEIEKLQRKGGQKVPNGLKVLVAVSESSPGFLAANAYRCYVDRWGVNCKLRRDAQYSLLGPRTKLDKDELDAYVSYYGYMYGDRDEALALSPTQSCPVLVLGGETREQEDKILYPLVGKTVFDQEWVDISDGIPTKYAVLIKRTY